MGKWQSTKTYDHNVGFSCAFRQWRAESHCRFLHGYALKFKFVFEADILDDCNWVQDFGGLRKLKAELAIWFDHTTIVTRDDPHLSTYKLMERQKLVQLRTLDNVGCEAFAKYALLIAVNCIGIAEGQRVRVVSCECSEHSGNSAVYVA